MHSLILLVRAPKTRVVILIVEKTDLLTSLMSLKLIFPPHTGKFVLEHLILLWLLYFPEVIVLLLGLFLQI